MPCCPWRCSRAQCALYGSQIPLRTDNTYSKARIEEIDDKKVRADLDGGSVVVVAGFQGVDGDGNITTLGRGGSDTTAVALAAALKADECQIYTDVDGVYTTDPRVVDNARRLDSITFEEMLEMASQGSRSCRSALWNSPANNVPLRVLSSFQDGPGTLITVDDEVDMEKPVISGIAFTRDEAKIIVRGAPDTPGIAYKILGPVSAANIEVDMIVQNVGKDGAADFTFTVHRNDFGRAQEALRNASEELGQPEIIGDDKIAKVSLVGVGMRSRGCGVQDVRSPGQRRGQHRDDFHLRNQGVRSHCRRSTWSWQCVPALCELISLR